MGLLGPVCLVSTRLRWTGALLLSNVQTEDDDDEEDDDDSIFPIDSVS